MRTNCWAAALALGTATITLTSAVGAGQLKDVAPTSASPINVASLVGAWTLTAADDLNPDGTRVHAYGNNPQGLLIFDSGGRYSVQIFRANRLKFASGDKRQGTLEEYRDATLGMSSHFGHYTVNPSNQTITFTIDRASFPNWDGATQTRPFSLKGNDLEWHVPATPDGKTPISAWHRIP